jgi:predicted amidophosphoribosyltransferase
MKPELPNEMNTIRQKTGCPECTEEVTGEMNYCPACGTSLEDEIFNIGINTEFVYTQRLAFYDHEAIWKAIIKQSWYNKDDLDIDNYGEELAGYVIDDIDDIYSIYADIQITIKDSVPEFQIIRLYSTKKTEESDNE